MVRKRLVVMRVAICWLNDGIVVGKEVSGHDGDVVVMMAIG